MRPADLFAILGVLALSVITAIVVRARRRSHAAHVEELAGSEVCAHLKPALDLLRSRGHRVLRVGQNHPDLPLEIHLAPPFDPKAVYDELGLEGPAFVSERNVLYCKEDWCEIHPVG